MTTVQQNNISIVLDNIENYGGNNMLIYGVCEEVY